MNAVEDPKPTDDFRFCQWYKTSNSAPTGFVINSFGLKWISQRMKQKVTVKGEGKRVRVPDILSLFLPLIVKLQTLKALASRMLLVPRYHGMFLMG